jgi:hypothetical protein
MLVERRDGELVAIDLTDARVSFQFAAPSVDHALLARGRYDDVGVMHAEDIQHAKDNPALGWPDRQLPYFDWAAILRALIPEWFARFSRDTRPRNRSRRTGAPNQDFAPRSGPSSAISLM